MSDKTNHAAPSPIEGLLAVVDHYYARGWSLIPLKPGTKEAAVSGAHGGAGRYLTASEVKDELLGRGGGGLAVRLPRGVVGIDVDAYIKGGRQKQGAETMSRLEHGEDALSLSVGGEELSVGGAAEALGPLPPAPRSTSRAGDQVSGIRFYRHEADGPLGEPVRDPGPDVELIRWGHRYAVVSPTRHPETGATYVWLAPDGSSAGGPPRVADLPVLPEAWHRYLSAGASGDGAGALAGSGSGVSEAEAAALARDWLAAPDAPGSATCPGLGSNVAAALAAARREGPSGVGREDLKGPVLKLAQAGEAGCPGVRAALSGALSLYAGLADGGDHEAKFLHLLGTTIDRVRNPAASLQPWHCAAHAPDDFDPKEADMTSTTEEKPEGAERAPRVNRQNDAQPLVYDVTRRGKKGGAKGPIKRILEFRQLGAADARPGLDVSNPGAFYDWLHANLGRGELSGVFRRHEGFVRVPRIGEDGWKDPGTADKYGDSDDGPAQVRGFEPTALADFVQRTFWVYREKAVETTDGAGKVTAIDYRRTQATVNVGLLGEAVAGSVEWTGVPAVTGVSHTPMMRADGSVLSVPGYDPPTGVLFLPERGFVPTRIPEEPVTAGQLEWARAVIDYLIQDFPFETELHRANYIALLLTPLVRAVVPPPYPMFAINAHQRGSGKSLLAKVAGVLHGSVHRPPLSSDNEELRKQFTSILLGTTAPIVNFDNVEGVIRAKEVANLLTTDTWSDRPLGKTASIEMRNDRLWLVTGNNIRVGGDLPRRVQWVTLDPGVERPELRTGFREADLVGYARANRDQLLVALLLIVKAWVERGMPVESVRSDDYARWAGVMKPIIEGAGWGGFEGVVAEFDTVKSDDEVELGVLLEALRARFGAGEFEVRDVRLAVEGATTPGEAAAVAELDEAIPSHVKGMKDSWKSLGRYLLSHEKQFEGGLRVVSRGSTRSGARWAIESRNPETV